MLRALLVVAMLCGLAPRANAFCGLYVNTGTEMFNDATHVVFTRVGTRTLLAMQNN